jgi:hypothetical protein
VKIGARRNQAFLLVPLNGSAGSVPAVEAYSREGLLTARSYRSPIAQALAGIGTRTGHSWLADRLAHQLRQLPTARLDQQIEDLALKSLKHATDSSAC